MKHLVALEAVRIDAAPYRIALTEAGGLMRRSSSARAVWSDLYRRVEQDAAILVQHHHEGGALVMRPSADFSAAIDQMRKLVEVEHGQP